MTQEYGFVWRSLRRLGVPEADADDGAQRVLAVFAAKLGDVAVGAERSFLFQTALRVASDMRRAQSRYRAALGERVDRETCDHRPGPEDALAQQEARALLGRALDALELDLCAVFVLFELEELTTSEVAGVLGIPPGTVSSRLRRAREEFAKIAERLRTDIARPRAHVTPSNAAFALAGRRR